MKIGSKKLNNSSSWIPNVLYKMMQAFDYHMTAFCYLIGYNELEGNTLVLCYQTSSFLKIR